MVSNAHAGPGGAEDDDVRRILDAHHDGLCAAMRAALRAADRQGQLRPGLDVDGTAQTLALLAYGVNLRSRAGAPATALTASVDAALASLTPDEENR
jgi:hypothetical protein